MRSGFTIVLMVTVLFAGGYFYNLAQAVCPIPLTYRVGEIDERFNLTESEAKVAIAEAAEVWEAATSQNLFIYDDEAEFTVNFIYDERQELVNDEVDFEEKLETAQDVNDALSDTYAALVAEYNKLKLAYADRAESYEQRFTTYNNTVRQYNEAGGAPKGVFEELEAERAALERERAALNALGKELNELVAEINAIGEKGNSLIKNYNENVGEFNERFGQFREFTQGDYMSGRINIYTYKDEQELQTVLVHEFGHALSLDHVEGDASVMHYLIGGQPADLALSSEDVAEFNRVCGDMNLWDKIVYRLNLFQK